MKTCSKCNIDKPLSDFHFRKDTNNYRNVCKVCWDLIRAKRRYGVTIEQAKEFYEQSKCLCCGQSLLTKKERHLHHVNHAVKGILCKYCNFALGQETNDDKHRIESCLKFIGSNRENLFDRVDQQGSRQTEPDPSTTTRRAQSEHKVCKTCKRLLPLSQFYRQKRTDGERRCITRCKECQKIYVKTKQYGISFEQVKQLRQMKQCDCCGIDVNIPFIHHIGDKVLGVTCLRCNSLLEQETEETKYRLQSCANWLMMI